MNLLKTGKFISECRRKQKLTQSQLAEKLNITDRAVSKWETGRALPDASIMLELCSILKISVNDLLSGEVVTMNEYNQKHEQMLLEVIKEKQESDKRLLQVEVYVGIISSVVLLASVIFAAYANIETWMKVVIILIGLLLSITGFLIALRIEQIAGYYECKKCGHKYVPTFKAVNLAMHLGRTRYLKCPHCGKRSWNKKVVNK